MQAQQKHYTYTLHTVYKFYLTSMQCHVGKTQLPLLCTLISKITQSKFGKKTQGTERKRHRTQDSYTSNNTK